MVNIMHISKKNMCTTQTFVLRLFKSNIYFGLFEAHCIPQNIKKNMSFRW